MYICVLNNIKNVLFFYIVFGAIRIKTFKEGIYCPSNIFFKLKKKYFFSLKNQKENVLSTHNSYLRVFLLWNHILTEAFLFFPIES